MSNTSKTATNDSGSAPAECDHARARANARFCPDCGGELSRPPEFLTAARPDWSQRARRRVRIAAIAVGLVVTLVLGLGWVQHRWYSPSEPVERYMAALDEDPAAAIEMLDGAKGAADSPLLDPDVLSDGYVPPNHVRVTDIEYGVAEPGDETGRTNRDWAQVAMTYSTDNGDVEAEVPVWRDESGWFRQWSIDPDQLASTVTGDIGHLSQGASYDIAAATIGTGDQLVALPGTYTVTAAGDDLFDTADTEQVHVPVADAMTYTPHQSPRNEVVNAVEAQVEGFIDDCAADGGPDPECGWNDDTGAIDIAPSSTSWTIEEYPQVELRRHDDPDDQGPLVTSTTTPGIVTGEYETVLDEARTVEASITVHGYVTTTDDGDAVWRATQCAPGHTFC